MPLSPTQSKSRSLAVTCPMCDSVGYTTPDNAGQSVKCVNRKCPVPVFTAPRPVAEKPVAAKSKKPKSNVVGVGGVTLAIMTVGGVIAWWVAGRPNDTVLKGPSDEDKELIKSMYSDSTPPVTAKTDVAETKDEPKKIVGNPTPKKADSESPASFGPILTMLNEASLQRVNRSKPFCRRLSAEAFALAGDLKGAQDQLTALDKVGPDVLFYRVSPLVQIAWQQFAKGQKKAAAKSLDEALVAAQKLPTTGRSRFEYVISLASVLVAADRAEEADTLLESHTGTDSAAELAKDIGAVQAMGTFDLAELFDRRPALNWHAPLTVGVVYDLVGHQQSDAARQWADRRATDRERAEAIAAWTDAVTWNAKLLSQPIPVKTVREAAEALPSPGNVLALSRLGLSLSWAGNSAAAQECLDAATAAVSAWEPAVETQLPEDLKELSKFTAPAFEQAALQVAAVGETAHLAAQLGQQKPADEFLTMALTRARNLAPASQVVQQRKKQIVAGGISALRSRLKQEWELKTDEQARVAANTLQKNLDQLAESAQQRVDLQRHLLAEATAWGRSDAVWAYIRRDGSAAEMAAADNLFFTELPALLIEKYRAAGQADQAETVATAWTQAVSNRKLTRPFPDLLREAIAGKSLSAAGVTKLLEQFHGESEDLDGIVLRAVSRLASTGDFTSAFNFAGKLEDPVLKEECYQLVASLSARRQEAKAAEMLLPQIQQASDKVAIGRGLIGGWVARQALKPAAATVEQ